MSITTVNFQPKIWSAAYNPIIWSVSSDRSTSPDMKYVFDIYVNGATGSNIYTYRIKQRPNPAGVGMIDVSTFAQPAINMSVMNPELASTQFRRYIDIAGGIHVKVGEEYLSNGALTIFNGSGATGAPNYFLSPYGATGQAVRFIPAALDFNTQVNIMNEINTYNPFWDQYVMDGNGKFLTTEPGFTRSVRMTDRHTLAFLNRWDNTLGSFANSILGIKVVTYTSSGAILGQNDYYNTTVAGGGPQNNNTYVATVPTNDTNFLYFRCGPIDFGFSSPSLAYYTVTAYVKLTATSDPTMTYTASQTYTFNIDRDCRDLYPNVRLSWLNSLGGRDYYNFNMFYEKTTTGKEELYNQNLLNYSGTTPRTTTNGTSSFNRGGDKVFNKVVETKFQIQSDWLTQEYVDYLAEIPQSSQVWAYIGDDYNTPYTVIIENMDYTYKNVKQTKLVQATFTCRYTKTQIKQNM